MRMRMHWVMALSVFGLLFAASVVSRPVPGVLPSSGEIHLPSIMIDQLTANAKGLPVQSFDAY